MAIKVLDNLVAEGKQVPMYRSITGNINLILLQIDTARKIIATPSSVRTYITMIEHLYKSGEYMDDLDLLENLTDTLLQIIMDDGIAD